ncbi:MAG: hypothetical protein DSY82_07565 [Flavobacteriia bacterium]|nr:MAG: hypothetical protein DSY82_07565 [Flavobacteriia bacterium]
MKEIESIHEFREWLNEGVPYEAAVKELDLTSYEDVIFKHNFNGCLFLGCDLSNHSAGYISCNGGMVISNRKDVLFEVFRAKLYSPKELFKGFDLNNKEGYKCTYDYKIYEDYIRSGMDATTSILVTLTRRLHDHSITDALQEIIEGRKVVAIMGGHSMERKDPYYLTIAKISRILTRKGFLMVSGGGPGAMEATHLGAYFATRTEKEMENAIDEMKIRPKGAANGKEYADQDWLHRAWRVLEKYPIPEGKEKESMSVGIPTWLYGHEPPTVFATHIAKYFANSIREDGLVTIAKHGIVFAPGSAGTTQEIFQDATQNHYAPYNTIASVKKYISPMILFGVEHWTKKRPLWTFMQEISKGQPCAELLYLTEDAGEVVEKIVSYDPEKYSYPR